MVKFRGTDDVTPEDVLEIPLILSCLKGKRTLSRNALWKQVHFQQEQSLGRLGLSPHGCSAFNYWIRELKKIRFLEENDNDRTLLLTQVGEWVADFTKGEFHLRESIARLSVCEKCSINKWVIIDKILFEERKWGKRGIDIKGECRLCGNEKYIWFGQSSQKFTELHKDFLRNLGIE